MTTDSYKGDDLEALADMPNYYSWIMDVFTPFVRGAVVEYGSGVGTVSAHLKPLSANLTLVEPSPNLAAQLRSRFDDDGKVIIIEESLEAHAAQVDAGTVDTFVLVNVLEHIEDDQEALYKLMNALRPGGHLLIFVPALQFLMSKFDRSIGHFRRYHKPDLVSKVQEAGGALRLCRYFDVLGVLPWFIFNTVLRSTTFNPTLVDINDRYAVPLTRGLESAVSAPFGKNIILVASKS